MSDIKVSVIVPTYNREFTIRRCLNSIINQTMPHNEYEIIIVDDCSNDSTYYILKKYKLKYPKLIKLFQLQNNSGSACLPRNKGMDESSGEYILFVDSDDKIKKYTLKDSYNFAIECNADILFIKRIYDFKLKYKIKYEGKISKLNFYDHSFFIWTLNVLKFFKLNKLKSINLKFNLKYRIAEDQLFVLTFICHTNNISLLDDKLYYIQFYNEKYNTNHLYKEIMDIYLFFDLYKEIFLNINNSTILSSINKSILLGLYLNRCFINCPGLNWINDINNIKNYSKYFNDFSDIINNYIPIDADKYCNSFNKYLLTVFRQNNFECFLIINNLIKEITNIQGSFSWKITKPIRLIKQYFNKNNKNIV